MKAAVAFSSKHAKGSFGDAESKGSICAGRMMLYLSQVTLKNPAWVAIRQKDDIFYFSPTNWSPSVLQINEAAYTWHQNREAP